MKTVKNTNGKGNATTSTSNTATAPREMVITSKGIIETPPVEAKKEEEVKIETPIKSVSLKTLKLGTTLRSVGSKKVWMVGNNQAKADKPFIHIFSEKASYKIKDLENQVIVITDNGGKLPTSSTDAEIKNLVAKIQEHLDIAATISKEKEAKENTKKLKEAKEVLAVAVKSVEAKATAKAKKAVISATTRLAKIEAIILKATESQVK